MVSSFLCTGGFYSTGRSGWSQLLVVVNKADTHICIQVWRGVEPLGHVVSFCLITLRSCPAVFQSGCTAFPPAAYERPSPATPSATPQIHYYKWCCLHVSWKLCLFSDFLQNLWWGGLSWSFSRVWLVYHKYLVSSGCPHSGMKNEALLVGASAHLPICSQFHHGFVPSDASSLSFHGIWRWRWGKGVSSVHQLEV